MLKSTNTIPKDLTIYTVLPEIVQSIKKNQITVVKCATGSGKTIGMPPVFVDNNYVVRVSLPTIPSTLSAYKFICENANNKKDVGYACHGDVYYNRLKTKLAYCTTKHLINDLKYVLNGTRKLPNNFLLMIDEAHHTSIENKALLKIALYMIKKGIQMKLVIASATLGEITFNYFENFTSQTVQSESRLYPIIVHWNDKDIDLMDTRNATNETVKKVTSLVGDSNRGILVFVAGESDVETVASQIETIGLNTVVYRLYSNMPTEEIMMAFEPVQDGFTKIVVSTNITESSITITDVSIVVDMGCQKTPYDDGCGIKLVTEFAPKDKLTQRKGRSGRTCEGDYYPMFTQEKWDSLQESDMSDMDRMMPYMIVLELLDVSLNAKEILEIDDEKYNIVITKLLKLQLMDENNKITELGNAVPHYPFSLENAVIAYKSYDFISNPAERNDAITVAILILISMIEGSQGCSFFWIPKEYRKNLETKILFMDDKFAHFKGDNDFITFINIFADMVHNSDNSEYGYVRWAQENSMNNKLLKNVRRNFKKLMSMTYQTNTTNIENDMLVMLRSYYNIHSLTQLTDDSIMHSVYSLFENVYSENNFDDPLEIGKKKILHYNGNDDNRYKIDKFRSFSKIENIKPHRIVSLQVLETRNGRVSNFYISCIFPSRDQTVKSISSSDLYSINSDFDIDIDSIDFSNMTDIFDSDTDSE